MKSRIDVVSLLVGVVLGVTLMLATGASGPSSTVGRYQIGGTASHGLVLDTATGQVWSAFLTQNSGKSDPDFYQLKLGKGEALRPLRARTSDLFT